MSAPLYWTQRPEVQALLAAVVAARPYQVSVASTDGHNPTSEMRWRVDGFTHAENPIAKLRRYRDGLAKAALKEGDEALARGVAKDEAYDAFRRVSFPDLQQAISDAMDDAETPVQSALTEVFRGMGRSAALERQAVEYQDARGARLAA